MMNMCTFIEHCHHINELPQKEKRHFYNNYQQSLEFLDIFQSRRDREHTQFILLLKTTKRYINISFRSCFLLKVYKELNKRNI